MDEALTGGVEGLREVIRKHHVAVVTGGQAEAHRAAAALGTSMKMSESLFQQVSHDIIALSDELGLTAHVLMARVLFIVEERDGPDSEVAKQIRAIVNEHLRPTGMDD